MEKQTYYVSVQSGDILENKGDAPFEFEIEATPKEINVLQEMFEFKGDADLGTLVRSHIPGISYHQDEANDDYDVQLVQVYRMIYQLGTPETKQHIEKMGILKTNAINEGY